MSDTIQTAELVGNTSYNSLSLFGMMMQADVVVKLVMLVLLFMSIWCWAIIFTKTRRFREISNLMDKFERKFWSGYSLSQLYDKLKINGADHPMAALFVAAMQEWSDNITYKNISSSSIKTRIENSLYITGSRELNNLSSNLSILATANSSATYIGLFGTVWGIMSSFQSIAAAKNTTLAVVAPGIAEALFATAMGLVVAIPAGIFYNILLNRFNKISERAENFAGELINLLSRELDQSAKQWK